MAPPDHTFPISELEHRVHVVTRDYKEKSRKLPKDFDLKRDCELFKLVQYSCTTADRIYEKKRKNPMAEVHTECIPFVRLFRRCGQGEKMFHVETTAWEGQHAWKPPSMDKSKKMQYVESSVTPNEAEFASYGSSYLWSNN